MTTAIRVRRTLVALRLPTSVPSLLALASAILKSMTENPAFATPPPSLATLSGAIAALQAGQAGDNARTR